MDLLGTRTPQGKFYIQDANADGILSALPGSGDVDTLREDNVRETLFNGDPESQGLTFQSTTRGWSRSTRAMRNCWPS